MHTNTSWAVMVQIDLNKVALEEIRAELDRILSSPYFRASKRHRDFLRFVVEEALAGRADTIKAYIRDRLRRTQFTTKMV